MSDKSAPPLNLIERMAQRMARQEPVAAKPAMNVDAAPARENLAAPEPRFARNEPVAPVKESMPATEPRFARSESASPAITPDVVRAAPVGGTVPVEPVRRAPGVEVSRQVHLDFRVLRQNGMITPDNMGSAISHEFRGVKRRVLQRARDPQTRAAINNLIMVTSSLPGEGKTFTSLNLAISLAAERGLQVLLIDADVVRPSIGNVFKSLPGDGLTDLLSGKARRVSDVMCRCAEVPNLSVMFSGSIQIDAPELISSGKMAELCTELSTRYSDRIVIIDTPPVLASPEPAILASYVHQLLMVVAADQTSRHQLRKSLEGVAACKNISLLFNMAPKWNETEYTPYYGYANSGTQPASA